MHVPTTCTLVSYLQAFIVVDVLTLYFLPVQKLDCRVKTLTRSCQTGSKPVSPDLTARSGQLLPTSDHPCPVSDEPQEVPPRQPGGSVVECLSSLLMLRANKLVRLYLAITCQSSLTFAGNTRSLPKKEASKMGSYWVGSGLALKL